MPDAPIVKNEKAQA